MRLDGLISHTAALSRAAAREKIQKGRVTVDGAVLRDPAAHVLDTQAVTLDGLRVQNVRGGIAQNRAVHRDAPLLYLFTRCGAGQRRRMRN